MEDFKELGLVSLVQTYRILNRGKCTPNRYRLPNMGSGCIPNEYKLQSRLKLVYYLLHSIKLIFLCPKLFLLDIRAIALLIML